MTIGFDIKRLMISLIFSIVYPACDFLSISVCSFNGTAREKQFYNLILTSSQMAIQSLSEGLVFADDFN